MALLSDGLGAGRRNFKALGQGVAQAVLGVPGAWRDRAGNFSGLRLSVLLLIVAPLLWLALAIALGAAGVRPIETALDVTGVWTVRFLLLSLAVTPLRRIFGWSRLLRVRRMLGLATAAYAGLHFALFIAHQNFDLVRVASEIALRIYLTIGFVALIGLAILAITSTDRWIKKLGPGWNRLHRLAYTIAGLGLLHFLMQSKFDVSQAVFYLGCFLLLMTYRIAARLRVELKPLMLGAVAALAVPVTAAVELGWHALSTSAPLASIWAANFDFAFGVSAAWRVGVLAAAVALLALLLQRRAQKA